MVCYRLKFGTKYILKTDDDVYVRIPRVLEYLVNATFPAPLCGGVTYWRPSKVNRTIGSKWTISWKYYGETHFPKYNPGAFVILSSDLLNRLLNYVYKRKPFHIDDAYIGLAMRDFGVNITKISSFALRHDMNTFIHNAKDCQILRLDAIGDNVDPKSLIRFVCNRLKLIACGRTPMK